MTGARVTIPHVRALDGLRGLAVAGVLLYHGDHLLGGYLGVDLFFVLSGFLITSLLLAEWHGTGRVSLGAFWARRARRLLPALALVLLGVALYCIVFAEPTELGRIRGDALATVGYVANWRAIYAGQSYFEIFSSPSPLQHTWSLAIEEQFYLLWPLLFVGLARFAKRRTPQAVLGAALSLGAMSALAMLLLHDPANLNRAYYGTDTRAYALFAGIAAAAAVTIWGHAKDPMMRAAIETCAMVSVVVLAVMWSGLDAQSERLYVGGFGAAGAAGALVCLAVANPRRGPIGWALSFPPICWLGLISYGLYLWHWPVDIVVSADRTGLQGWTLFAVQTAVAVAIAVASYRLVELPIRRGTLRLRRPLVLVPALAASVVLVMVLSTGAATDADASSGALVRSGQSTRVLLVGDSMARSLEPGLQRAGIPVGLWWSKLCRLIDGRLAFHPEYAWTCPWRVEFPKVMAFHRPQRVLLLIGIGDMFSVRPTGEDVVLTPGSPAWADHFERALTDAVAIFKQGGARVTLLTLPCAGRVGPETRGDVGAFALARVRAENRVIEAVAAADPQHVDVADTFGLLCPRGRFEARVHGVATRRDGVHLSDTGADLVAHWLATSAGLKPGR